MGAVLTDYEIMCVANARSGKAGLCVAALSDTQTEAILCDFVEEEGIMNSPFEIGKKYIVKQNTLYYVGVVVEIGFGWIRLDKASWIHWTGKIGTLMARKNFGHQGWPSGDRKPRTEYIGDGVIIFNCNSSSAYQFDGEIPTESI